MILWKNAKFYTMKDAVDYVDKVLTDNGLIVAVNEDVYQYRIDKTIDLSGKFVFPGFTDNHLHLIGYGRKLKSFNLNASSDKETVIEMIRSFYSHATLKVEGYLNIGLTKDDLDKISNDQVIILRHNDYHSYTVNSYTLNLLNIKHETGILIEDAGHPVDSLWSKMDKAVLEDMTSAALYSLHQYGITSIISDDLSYFNSYEETLSIINKQVIDHKMRTNLLIHHSVLDSYLDDKERLKIDNKYLTFNWVKVFYDGTLSSKTALLRENYANEEHNGQSMGHDEFISIVKKSRLNNLNIAVHTIGDQALAEVADILKENPPNEGYDRIIHASLADMDTIKKLSKMNIILDIQPQFIESDLPRVLSNFSHQPMVYPFKSYLRHNLTLGGSSDAPVETPNPLQGIYLLETRIVDLITYHQAERLTRFESISCYTQDAIRNKHIKKGFIDVGHLADFTVFSKDIMHCPLEMLKENLFEATIVDEQIVFQKR